MTERPILFSAPMVRAILEGRKTQTRRLYKTGGLAPRCPYGVPGDRLWVRESYSMSAHGPMYKATDPSDGTVHIAWSNSMFMPRRFSRIALEITEVRNERLEEISEEDAKAEGAMFHNGGEIGHSGWRHDYTDVYGAARDSFGALWNTIHGKSHPWGSSPFVWCLSFKVLKNP